MSIHVPSVIAIAASLIFTGLPAMAQSARQAVIVTSPAVVIARDARAPEPVVVAPTPPGVVIINPSPLPPTPPNACQRGNSSGVSRC